MLLVPLFVSLGFWQLGRAQERDALNVLQDLRAQEVPLVISERDRLDPESIRYRQVVLEGQFDRAHQFLVDNQLDNGNAGYHVLVPFRLSRGGQALMVNRGWLPVGSDRKILPDIGGLPEGIVTVKGRADLFFRVGLRLKGAEIPSETWPSLVQVPESQALSRHLGYAVEGFQVLLDPAEKGGFGRHFRSVRLDVSKNRGYALQWFLFAAATFIIFVRSSLRKSTSPS
jgi:surfeit locus 1 family protein